MSLGRRLIPLAVLVSGAVALTSCGDQSPLGIRTPALAAATANSQLTGTSTSPGLVACSQRYTTSTDCGVATSGTLRVAQGTDALADLGYLHTSVQGQKNPWSQGNLFVTGLAPHFSNYAVAW
jgi:hypothetical protein